MKTKEYILEQIGDSMLISLRTDYLRIRGLLIMLKIETAQLGPGFNKFDKELGLTLADLIMHDKDLSKNQMQLLRTMLPKYVGQITDFVNSYELVGLANKVSILWLERNKTKY